MIVSSIPAAAQSAIDPIADLIDASGSPSPSQQNPADDPIGALISAPRPPIVEQPALFTNDDFLLVEVDVGDEQLTDSFGIYSSRSGVFLPLGELARLTDLAIAVDPGTKRAEGWVLNPSRTVIVDLGSGRATAGGNSFALSPSSATLLNGEIYLRQDVVEQLLPLRLRADAGALTLTLTPTAPLPFQQRVERDRRRAGLGAAGEKTAELFVVTPYTAFTPPAFDLDVNTGAGNHSPKGTLQYTVRTAGDLAYMGVQAYLTSDQYGRPSDARILFERKDPEGRNAGPFGATRSDLGDTYSPQLPLGARSASGRGFALTSSPLQQASVFSKIDFRGELQEGYQVELYINEVLRGSQASPIQGRYEFLSVPMSYGINVVRLVFYGPRGERREQVERLNVGGAQLAKGETNYSVGAVQEGWSLIPIGTGNQPASVATPGFGQWRIAGVLSHGLTDNATVSVGFARYTPFLDVPRYLWTSGIVTSFQGIAIQVDGARDDKGGSAIAVGMAGRWLGTSVVIRDAEYGGGFVDELQAQASSSVPLRRDTTLWIDTQQRIAGTIWPLSLRLERSEQVNHAVLLQTTAQTSHPFGRYLISSTLTYQESGGSSALAGQVDGSGLVRGGWQVRGGFSYRLAPSAHIDAASVTADRNLSERTALHLGVIQSFGSGSQTTLQVGNTWRLDRADVSFVGSYTTRSNDFRVGVHVSLGLLYDPLRKRYRALGPNLSDGGSIALQAFIDRNGNNRPDADDTWLPNLAIQGGRRPTITNQSGEAIVTGLGSGAMARIQVDTASIEDPYLTPPPTTIRIVPRPGRVASVAYPLHSTAEVELRVYFSREGSPDRGLSALDIQLLDPDGKVVSSGRTEYDGTLLLEGLQPGTYHLRIEPTQATRLHLGLGAPIQFTVPPSGGFVGRVNAKVVRDGKIGS